MVKAWSRERLKLGRTAACLRVSRAKKNPASHRGEKAGLVSIREDPRAHAKDPRLSASRVPRPTALTYDDRSADGQNTPLARSDKV